MEEFIRNSNLKNIAWKIFKKLDHESLKNCVLVNKSFSDFLYDSGIWFEKCLKNGYFSENENQWLNFMYLISKDKILSQNMGRILFLRCDPKFDKSFQELLEILANPEGNLTKYFWNHDKKSKQNIKITPLQLSVIFQEIDLVKFIISYFDHYEIQEDVNQSNKLAIASCQNSRRLQKTIEIVKILVPLDQKWNQNIWYIIGLCEKLNQSELLKELLKLAEVEKHEFYDFVLNCNLS